MKKNILLTCFGGNVFYEFFMDFKERPDIELFVADMNPRSKARLLTKNFISVLPAEDPDFFSDLLTQANAHGIRMIIPGGDEEALALMKVRQQFEDEGIIVAIQDMDLYPIFKSKTALYDQLKLKGFPVPLYRKFSTKDEFENILDELGYPAKPLLVKPNSARGGRGITILSERLVENKDHLALFNKELFVNLIDGTTEFLMMEYFDGTVYDIDVLKYKNGTEYFGIRKRFNNVTKLFSGNVFEKKEEVLKFAQKLYAAIPTKYLLDYDFMVEPSGKIHLLEINPRPSGSTISFLPFGINLYYVLAKSYLDNEHIPIDDSFDGEHAVTFYKMVKGGMA